ncbi:LAME_0E12596g1_1 [Lachancea meyersii CBS 8951]|uniref:LAME_0E12596g1_1 n=1 Tax=Lachancea meyersii CBS 8951 TaxID=1266667 RepID=A0A1G4JLQ7_9SACH|nr:LAME_0E12596g1_1 [Lachancea meyersii CBS 8951]
MASPSGSQYESLASGNSNIAIPHPFSTPQATPVGKQNPRPLSPPRSETASGTSCFSKQGVLVNQVATVLSALTSKFSNHRVNNTKPHLVAYLTKVIKRTKCSKKIVLLSIFYFHKLYTRKLDSITNLPEFSRCSKRVYLCCLILAHKFLNDQSFSMASWQKISGLSCKDISTMERWCLNKLDYELFTTDLDLTAWCDKHIHNEVVEKDSCSRKRVRDLESDSTTSLPNKRLHSSIVITIK